MKIIQYILLILGVCLPGILPAQENSETVIRLRYESPKQRFENFVPFKRLQRKKIGVAFSGGGLRGLSHIGVLKVLNREQIPIDYIAGTSIGAIIGGLCAIGYSPEEIENMTGEIDWNGIFQDRPARSSLFLQQKDDAARYLFRLRFDGWKPYIPAALSKGQKLSDILSLIIMRASFIPYLNFDDFKIPFRAVATNLITGEKEVIGKGDLGRAMVGSSAAPLLFSPVEMDGKLLVDGGLVTNLPAMETREMGADYVLGVNAMSPLKSREHLNLPWEQADQALTIMQNPVNKKLLKECDLVITPDLGLLQSYDQATRDSAIEKGMEAAEKMIPQLKALIDYIPAGLDSEKQVFSSIDITGNENIVREFIVSKLGLFAQNNISVKDIYRGMAELYRTGYFSDVFARIIHEKENRRLLIVTRENSVISEFKFHGNNVVEDDVLSGIIADQAGRTFNFLAGEELFQKILIEYRNRGYSLAEISDVEIDSSGICNVFIDEGVIESIVIQGNEHIKDYVIKREIPIKEREVFDLKKIRKAVANIYSTGLFERVYVTFRKNGRSRLIYFTVEERKHNLINFGAQYSTDIGTHGFIEFENESRFGLGVQELLHLQSGLKDQKYYYELKANRIFTTYFTFNARAYYNEFIDYLRDEVGNVTDIREIQKGIQFSFGHQLSRLGILQMEFKIERSEYRTLPDPNISGGNEIRALTFRSIVDTRDRLPFPKAGKYHELYYETATRQVLEGSLPYVKFYSSLESYYTFGSFLTVRPRIRAGFSDQTIPFTERFRIGGRENFLGLKRNELHGRAVIAGNMEVRFNIPFMKLADMYLTTRYDVAGLWEKVEDIEGDDLIHGIGASLSLDLPFGPLDIAYGRASGRRERVYVTLGYDF